MGADPNNLEPVKKLFKEKDIEIERLKKKPKIPEGHHIQTPEVVALQIERDEFL